MYENARILLAEDDLTTSTILTAVLRKWGYEPVVVRDGRTPGKICSNRIVLAWLFWIGWCQKCRVWKWSNTSAPRWWKNHLISFCSPAKMKWNQSSRGWKPVPMITSKKPFDNADCGRGSGSDSVPLNCRPNCMKPKKRLEHLATHDPLTGILNRRAILESLSKELSRVRRQKKLNPNSKLCIGYFDLDQFKTNQWPEWPPIRWWSFNWHGKLFKIRVKRVWHVRSHGWRWVSGNCARGGPEVMESIQENQQCHCKLQNSNRNWRLVYNGQHRCFNCRSRLQWRPIIK